MPYVNKVNNQSLGEEIANGVSHCVGALLAIAGTAVLIVRACFTGTAMGIVSAALYGASLILLYCFSTIYHSLTNHKAKSVFRIFDHCSIFILIVGSYIPISLVLIRQLMGYAVMGWVLFGVNVLCMVIGIVTNSISLERWEKLSLILYVAMGWSSVMILKYVLTQTGLSGFMLFIAGGLAYTLGIIFYKLKKVKYMHFIWHLFVLAGSILHFFFIMFYCYPY
ncbi:MAG: hemolysin III family protein [Bacillota bacterium]|nr:hemolysin III family protein [Bacillota bacterium]